MAILGKADGAQCLSADIHLNNSRNVGGDEKLGHSHPVIDRPLDSIIHQGRPYCELSQLRSGSFTDNNICGDGFPFQGGILLRPSGKTRRNRVNKR